MLHSYSGFFLNAVETLIQVSERLSNTAAKLPTKYYYI